MRLSTLKKAKDNKSKVLAELFQRRTVNIEEATTWPKWEIEDQLKRAQTAKEGFLSANPMHDLSIIEEHISQLTESLKIKSSKDADL